MPARLLLITGPAGAGKTTVAREWASTRSSASVHLQLDTFNITGGSTSNNALWAGLPVLTKLGKSYSSRVTGSLLTAIGFPELMTTTEAEYEALALKLATNPKLLSKIRQRLDANRLSAPLFDTESFTKHLEEGYQKAYQRYFDGKEPGVIFVTEQSETMPL